MHMWTDTLTHTHKYGNKAQRRSVPSCILCNNVLFLPVFSPPPPSVSLASHDELDVIFPFFPLNLGEQKQASICACLCVCTVWCTRMCVCVCVCLCELLPNVSTMTWSHCSACLLLFFLFSSITESLAHTHTHTDAHRCTQTHKRNTLLYAYTLTCKGEDWRFLPDPGMGEMCINFK